MKKEIKLKLRVRVGWRSVEGEGRTRRMEEGEKGMVNPVGGVDRERGYNVFRGTWHEL